VIATPLLLAALLIAAADEAQGPPITGVVVDGADKPVAGVEVVLACGRAPDGSVPVLARGRTDEKGGFRLPRPPEAVLSRTGAVTGAVWAYGPGRALSGARWTRFASAGRDILRITMREPGKRTVTVTGPDGRALAGLAVAPPSVYQTWLIYGLPLPDEIVDRLAATTGPDGKADLPDLSADSQVQVLRLQTDGGTVQVRALRPTDKVNQQGDVELTLDGPGGLVGSVAVGGTPAAGLTVEFWSKVSMFLDVAPVRFAGGPLRTGADGSFQTPPTLWRGHAYRAVVRAPGMPPRVSPWVTLDGPLGVIPELRLEPSREVAGRVTDRAGTPLSGVEVFQAGDGPEPTVTATDEQGRFRLGGYDRDRGFLFARKPGYRFGGIKVGPGQSDVVLELTEGGREPERVLRTLPDPLPRGRMVALARRLVEPYLAWAVGEKDDNSKYLAFRSLMYCDPVGTMEQAEAAGITAPRMIDMLRARTGLALAADDPEEAAARIEAHAAPGVRLLYLIDLIDLLPADQHDRKLDLLERAAALARASADTQTKVFQIGEVAERLAELGAADRAKALFAEGKPLAEPRDGQPRPMADRFAARLARVDLPAALAIIERNPDPVARTKARDNAAVRVAAVDPAAAERLLRQTYGQGRVNRLTLEAVVRAMAKADPARARRLVGLVDSPAWRAHAWAFLAAGLPESDLEGRRDALRQAGSEFDRLPPGDRGELAYNPAATILPLVEAADPAAVEEFLWRAVSMRGPSFNPLDSTGGGVSDRYLLPLAVARYDRPLAATLFEPGLDYARDALPRGGERDATKLCVVAAMIDPELAVGLIESIPAEAKRRAGSPADAPRLAVAESLGQPAPVRWDAVWRQYSGLGNSLYDRDLR